MGGERYTPVVLFVLSMALAMTSVSAYTDTGTAFECDSCADCTAALNDNGRNTVLLTQDIRNFNGTCIGDLAGNPANFNNKLFDCQGNRIDGNGSYTADNLGIVILGKVGNTVRNCEFTDLSIGVAIAVGNNNQVTNNTFDDIVASVVLISSTNDLIIGNTFTGIIDAEAGLADPTGIFAEDSAGAFIVNNTIDSTIGLGIHLHASQLINLTNNTVLNAEGGILLDSTTMVYMSKNIMTGNEYNFAVEGNELLEFLHLILTDNLVDGGVVYYNYTAQDKLYDPINTPNAGFVHCILCDNITVSDMTFSNVGYTFFSWGLNNSRIENITGDGNGGGISIMTGFNNSLTNNVISGSSIAPGFYIHNNTNTTLVNNTALDNPGGGLYLLGSTQAYLSGNVMSDNSHNLYVDGPDVTGDGVPDPDSLSSFNHTILTDNLVDGAVVYYDYAARDLVYSPATTPDAGFIHCILCENITISRVTLNNNGYMFFSWELNNSVIDDVDGYDNQKGLTILSGNNNTISRLGTDSSLSLSTPNSIIQDSWFSGGCGIGISEADNVSILNNRLFLDSAGLGCGISLGRFANNLTISDNIITGAGIYFDTSENNTVTDNDISDCDTALYFGSSDNMTVSGNTIDNCLNGFYIFGLGHTSLLDNPLSGITGYELYISYPNELLIAGHTFHIDQIYYPTLLGNSRQIVQFWNNTFISELNSMQLGFDGVYFYDIQKDEIANYDWAIRDIRPEVQLAFARDGNKLYIPAPPRIGMFSFKVDIVDLDFNNTYENQTYYYFANVSMEQVLRYYYRQLDGTHGQVLGGDDIGIMSFTPAPAFEYFVCMNWIMVYANEILGVPYQDFYYNNATPFTGVIVDRVNSSFYYKSLQDDASLSIDWHASADDGIDGPRAYTGATAVWTQFNSTIHPSRMIYLDALTEFYNFSIKFGGSQGSCLWPEVQTDLTHPAYSDIIFKVYNTSFFNISNISTVADLQIWSMTRPDPDGDALMQTSLSGNTSQNTTISINGTGDVRLEVELPSGCSCEVYYDEALCEGRNCSYDQTGDMLDINFDLGSEHDITISPCVFGAQEEEEEEEDDETRGDTNGYVLVPGPTIPVEPGCTEDDDCTDDQYCMSPDCLPVPCPCGAVSDHSCTPYECCADSDCGEAEVCTDHKCVEGPEVEPEAEPPVAEKEPVAEPAQTPAEDWSWLWILLIIIAAGAVLVIVLTQRGGREKSLRSV